MDWENFHAFVATARHPTLTQAAHTLRISIATAARRLDALETELGLKLIDRTPQGLTVTPFGRKLLAQAEGAEDALAGVARLAATLRGGGPQENIRVSATEPVISEILAPSMPFLLDMAPGISIDLVVSNEIVSLAMRDADLAVRLAEPQGGSLIARRLPSLEMALYASSAYAARRQGIPLTEHRLIAYDDSYGRIPEVRWIADHAASAKIVLRTSSTRAIVNAAIAGVGVAILPRILAERHPQLVAIHAPAPIPARKLWLVWHRDLKRQRTLKTIRSWIVECFAAARQHPKLRDGQPPVTSP